MSERAAEESAIVVIGRGDFSLNGKRRAIKLGNRGLRIALIAFEH